MTTSERLMARTMRRGVTLSAIHSRSGDSPSMRGIA